MAKFKTDLNEIEEFQSKMQRVAKGSRGELLERLLKAGAQPIIDEWKASIVAHNHIRTRTMYDNVTMYGVKFDGVGGGSIDVAPDGINDYGYRNAMIAAIVNTGVPGQNNKKAGSKFVKEA